MISAPSELNLTTLGHCLGTAHAEPFDFAQDKLRPQVEVEACEELDLLPFDFPFDSASAPLRIRSGRAGKGPLRVREYTNFV